MRYLVLTMLLSGCAFVVGSTPVALPSGAQGYEIRCNGAVRSMGDCMNEAAKVCAGPYTIVGSNEGIHRTLVVSCGAH